MIDGESASVGWFWLPRGEIAPYNGLKNCHLPRAGVATCHVPGYWRVKFRYPFVNVYITMEIHHAIHGTTHNFYGHVQWLCCKLHYQRVYEMTSPSCLSGIMGMIGGESFLNGSIWIWFMWFSSHWIVIVQPDLWRVFRLIYGFMGCTWSSPPGVTKSVMVMTTRWLRMGYHSGETLGFPNPGIFHVFPWFSIVIPYLRIYVGG